MWIFDTVACHWLNVQAVWQTMKVRSREINTISMSALDMFCAALGAFMFLALLFFPFVPNLGPKAQDIAQLRRDNEQMKTELKSIRQQLQRAQDEQASDIAIVIDASGSMGEPILILQKEIADFAQVLGKLAGRARISVIAYRDRCLGQGAAVSVTPLTPLDSNGVAMLTNVAGGLKAEMAPCEPADTPQEWVYGGLREATRLNWSAPPQRRHIVVIGDQPPYPDEQGQAIAVARDWQQGGGNVSTLLVGSEPGAAEFYLALAEAGKGTSSAMVPGQSFAMQLLTAMTR